MITKTVLIAFKIGFFTIILIFLEFWKNYKLKNWIKNNKIAPTQTFIFEKLIITTTKITIKEQKIHFFYLKNMCDFSELKKEKKIKKYIK